MLRVAFVLRSTEVHPEFFWFVLRLLIIYASLYFFPLEIRSVCYILNCFSIHRIELFSDILSVDPDSLFITDFKHMSLKGSWNCRSNTAHECPWTFWIDAFRVFVFCSSLTICSSSYCFRLRCNQGVTYSTFVQHPPSCSIDFNQLPLTDPNSVRIRATHHPNLSSD